MAKHLGVRARKFENKACEVLKIKEFTGVNDCFQNERNAVLGLYSRTLAVGSVMGA